METKPQTQNTLLWKSHVRNLFDEIRTCTGKEGIALNRPLEITFGLMVLAAKQAAEVGDEKLIGFFCRMAIYDFSDPTNKEEYDAERTAYYINKTKENGN